MKIVVFGGNGFLGLRLVPLLRRNGHEVWAGRSAEVNLLSPVPLLPAFRNTEIVIHAAALYGGMPFDMHNQSRILAANTSMNLNVFEFCKQVRARQLITIGSACSYPGYVDHVLTEADLFGGPLHESVECHGFTKLWMIAAHRAYRSDGVRGVHLIPANLYGPGDVYRLDRAHVVAALIKKYSDANEAGSSTVQLLGDGSPIREFMHVDDLAKAIASAVDRRTDEITPINVGTGIGHSIRTIAAMIADKVGYRGRTIWEGAQNNGTQHKLMSVARLQAVLGPFEPIQLAAGIDHTLRWYLPRKLEADLRP